MSTFKNKFSVFVYALVVGMAVSTPILADDTEVFFGQPKKTNMFLVLDISGSMQNQITSTDSTVELVRWTQNTNQNISTAVARVTPLIAANPKARFATLQVDAGGGWTDYFQRNFNGSDLTIVYGGLPYRWVHKDSRMAVMKEALYNFLNDPETKDDHRVGMMTYTTSNVGNRYTEIIAEVKPLNTKVGAITHREFLVQELLKFEPRNGTPTAPAYYEATKYFAGTYKEGGTKFKSPIDGVCGDVNSLVLLTDGQPQTYPNNYHNDIKKITGSCDKDNDGNVTATNFGKECTEKLSDYYFKNDVKAGTPDSTIQTSTILFALNDNIAKDFLEKTASPRADGSKLAFTPTTADELSAAFVNSLANAVDNSSFVAPSVPLSQSNRLRSGNNVYLGMFQPEAKQNWNGNLKKYFLKNGVITQKDGVTPAVDPGTGNFFVGASSAWSNGDGDKVIEGGALARLRQDKATLIYTNMTTDTLDTVTPEFAEKYIDDSLAANDGKVGKLFDVNGIDKDTATGLFKWVVNRKKTSANGITRNRFGDPLHSRPQILTYNATTTTAYIATNQGYLHAIDTETGNERWAFYPRQLLKKVKDWQKNVPTQADTKREYGLDGQITIYSYRNNNGNIRHMLYVGMRRGGNYVYALDITDPNKPKMVFTVGNKFEADLQYTGERITLIPNLGQTWAKPVVAKIPSSNADKFRRRLILAGGYDEYYDDPANTVNPADGTIAGNAIYHIPFRGNKTNPSAFGTIKPTGMTNSIAADLTLIDIDNDSIVENIYAADVGGKIYRVDFTENSNAINSEVFADVSSDPEGSYRFYNKPDIAFVNLRGKFYGVVSLGSGYRVNPLNPSTLDKYYAFYDEEIANEAVTVPTLKLGDLLDVTNPDAGGDFADINDIFTGDATTEKNGWFIKLPKGEKVLSAATTLNFVNLFTTFSPTTSNNVCSVGLGSNKLYGISLVDGSPAVESFIIGDVDNVDDRYTTVAYTGIAPGVTLLFPDDTSIATLVGTQTICTGDDCDFLPDGVKTVKWKQTE